MQCSVLLGITERIRERHFVGGKDGAVCRRDTRIPRCLYSGLSYPDPLNRQGAAYLENYGYCNSFGTKLLQIPSRLAFQLRLQDFSRKQDHLGPLR